MYLPNTARSVLRARPVRGGPRCRLSSHSTRPWTMLGCCTRQLPTVVAHTHRTPIRHSVIRTARSRLGTCVLQHAGARAFLPLTRSDTSSWSLGKTVFIGARAPLSRQTSLCADARRGTCPHNHARLTHVVAHTSARTIVISNSELSSWHSHGATSLWYLPAAGAPDRVWNPSNECLGAHPAHQMPPPRCAPPRFDDRSLAF